MSYTKSASAGYLANQMARIFSRNLHIRLKHLGVAPAQFMTLLELWEQDGLTQKELLTRLGVEQATMANTLKRMLRDGLIQKVSDVTDKRTQIVSLTQKARELKEYALNEGEQTNALALDGISAAEQALFLKTMRIVIYNLQR